MSASATTIVVRGLLRRCGRCGGRRIFASYFRMKERCPTCGYRFVREPGAFTGAMLMNITATFVLMFVTLVAPVLWRGISGRDDIPWWPFVLGALGWAVLVPIVFYPIACSWWAAIDLAMRPLDPAEEADAEVHAA